MKQHMNILKKAVKPITIAVLVIFSVLVLKISGTGIAEAKTLPLSESGYVNIERPETSIERLNSPGDREIAQKKERSPKRTKCTGC